MQISVSGALSATLAKQGLSLPAFINIDEGFFNNRVEAHRDEFPNLGQDELEFLAKVDSAIHVAAEIVERKREAEARIEEQRRLEATMKTVDFGEENQGTLNAETTVGEDLKTPRRGES